jgi:Tol biopolymer transport system component
MIHLQNFNRCMVLTSCILFCAFTLSAQQYDIYVFDIKKGTEQKVTNGLNANMFNVAWSNNGKKLAYDVVGTVAQPFDQSIFVTDLQTGLTRPIAGAEGGNDAAWSPDGGKIAFDAMEDYYHINWWTRNIYSVAAAGGTRSLVRFNAHHASWNPDGNKVAFDDNYGYIATRDINTGHEIFITSFGDRPSWSPNGQYIAFDGASWIGGGIWVIQLDTLGYPIGWPVQVSNSGYGPSWKNNSREIVFVDWPDGDPDLYSIPATGGTATRIAGRSGGFEKGDYDPSYSNDGQFVAWSRFTDQELTPITQSNKEKWNTAVAPISVNNTALHQNFPNPFREETRISFRITEATRVLLNIYNMAGQKVHTLLMKNFDEGNYTVTWNGRNKNGNKLPAGIYIYHLQTKSSLLSGRMNLIE